METNQRVSADDYADRHQRSPRFTEGCLFVVSSALCPPLLGTMNGREKEVNHNGVDMSILTPRGSVTQEMKTRSMQHKTDAVYSSFDGSTMFRPTPAASSSPYKIELEDPGKLIHA